MKLNGFVKNRVLQWFVEVNKQQRSKVKKECPKRNNYYLCSNPIVLNKRASEARDPSFSRRMFAAQLKLFPRVHAWS